MVCAGNRLKVLIIVENLPVPFDRRVWQEATTLRNNGYSVSVVCPVMKGYRKKHEVIDGIHIYRHPLPVEGDSAAGYLIEYSAALYYQFMLSIKVLFRHGFDVIHACNPPDNIFIIGGIFKFFLGKKFLFDHHDINPELYTAKFGRKDIFYRLMVLWEKLTFKTADVSIATNASYRDIAVKRGGMNPEDVFIVRSGPDLSRARRVPENNSWKNGRKYMVGYVGVMSAQEGIDCLLEGIAFLVKTMKREDIQFVLVGGGTELENLKKKSCDLDIEAFVTFTGRLPDDALMEVLSTADVCVNPDLVNEMNDKSTMNKIMEYMALGKPVVQYDTTEGRFTAQGASLYAEPNNPASLMDNIIKLIDDPGLRIRMGKIGRERIVKELAWEYEVPKLLAAYEALN